MTDHLSDLYDMGDREVRTCGVDVPDWIDQDITCADVAAILEGGCESGAYMPAVTYYRALETMSEHGDDILDFVEGAYGDLPAWGDISNQSWAGMAVALVSRAVETWAASVADDIDCEEEDETDD